MVLGSRVVKVDRPNTGGFGLGHGKTAESLAVRLANAARAGKMFQSTYVSSDIYGQTYVVAIERVRGRTMNADLKRLGF